MMPSIWACLQPQGTLREEEKPSPAHSSAGVDDERTKLADCPSGPDRP